MLYSINEYMCNLYELWILILFEVAMKTPIEIIHMGVFII
jgi:hypothetical protein